MFLPWWMLYYIWSVGATEDNEKFSKELSIRTLILAGYDKTLPPSIYSTVVYSNLIKLYRVQGLDEKKGELITEAIAITVWRDKRFQWDDKDVVHVRVQAEQIWVPSLYVFNSIEPYEVTLNSLIYAYQSTLIWFRRIIFHTSCVPDMQYYPFDTQFCNIQMAVGSREGDALPSTYGNNNSSTVSAFIDSFYIPNLQWALQITGISKSTMVINGNKRDVGIFKLNIQRSMPLIPLGILTPSLTCVILLLCTFWLEAGSTVRTGLSATSMLVSTSSIFTLSKILPCHGSTTPIIVEYVAVTIILSAVATFQALFVSILSRYEKPPPISYTTLVSEIPLLIRKVLGSHIEVDTFEKSYLFSDLVDSESTNLPETGTFSNAFAPGVAQNISETGLHDKNLWKNHIVLFDRIFFMMMGLIIVLLVISVVITE